MSRRTMTPKMALLSAFKGRENRLISGADLAGELGLTRAAVWKQVKGLRADGFPIRSSARAGYRFDASADLSLMSLNDWTIGRTRIHLHYALNTVSTQRLAKSAAEQGALEGHLWIAETQSGGRGRLDRRWDSGFGGLWFSLILRPRLPPARVPALTLVAAQSLAKTLRRCTGAAVSIKWPNDLVARHKNQWRKVCGLLTEMSGEVDRVNWVVLGVGLNVFNEIPVPLRPIAASLAQLTKNLPERADLLKEFLHSFWPDYDRYVRLGFEPFRASYWSHYGRPEEAVTLSTSGGDIRGLARGVDGQGRLLVESRRQIRVISEGEIVL